jgi:hypothetical protein
MACREGSGGVTTAARESTASRNILLKHRIRDPDGPIAPDRQQEFIRFFSAERAIHVILNNYATLKHPQGHMVRTASALDVPLMPTSALAQRDRKFLCQAHETAPQAQHLPIGCRSTDCDHPSLPDNSNPNPSYRLPVLITRSRQSG